MVNLSNGKKQQVLNKLDGILFILGFDNFNTSKIINNWRYEVEEKEWINIYNLLYSKRRKSKCQVN